MEKLRKSLKKAKEASKPPDAMMPYSSTAQGRKRPTINPRTKNPDVGKNFSLGIQPYYQNTAPADDDSLVEITSAERERQPKTRKSKLEKIKQLQAYNHDLKVKQSELKQDVRNLTKQCRDIQRSSTIQLSSLEIQMNELKSELHKAKQKNKFQEPTEEQLDGRLLAIQALKQATQKQENRIVRLKGDLERRRYQSRAKDDRIHDLEKELVELKEKNTKSRQEFDSNQTEMAGLLRELTKAKDDYEQLQEEHEAWESERKQMQRNLRASTSQLLKEKSLRNIESIEKKGEEDNLQAMLTQKIEKITELKQDLERAEDELLEEREKNSKKELEIQTKLKIELRREYDEKLRIKESEIVLLKEEKEKSKKQNESVRSENEAMNERLNWLMEDSDRLRNELDEQAAAAKEDLARQKKEIEEKAAAETVAQVAAATAALEKQTGKVSTEVVKLQDEKIARLKEERDNSEKQNESLRSENQAMNEKVITLMKKSDNLKNELDENSAAAAKELARLRQELKEVASADTAAAIAAFEKESKKENEEKLKLKETEITRLKEERDDSEKQNERLRLDNKGMHERMSNLMKESDRLKKERDENATIAADNLARLRTELEERTAAAVKQVDSKGTQTDSNPSEEKGAESDVLKKELENLRTWAKAALQNVQRLEEDKAAAKKHTDTLEKKLAEMESQLLPQGVSLDDQSSIGSNTLMNYMRGDVDDDATISSTIDYDDASVNSNTHRKRGFFRKGAQSENGDKIITISEGEMFVKEEKIKSLQVAKNRHEKTIGNLVKEVMKLRKVQKEASLQMQSLQHEREAFKMKIAVLEKEFAIMEINTTANTQSEVAAKFQRASRLGSSGFVAETTTQLELRVKDQKISALEKLINEDKQLLSSIRSEMAALRVDAQKETKRHMQEIEKLRRENISFFQQVKILEKEKKDVENQLDEKKNEEKEIDESGLENITDGQSIRIIRELNKKIRDRDKKIDALKKYNEMMEKTVAQLRTEYMNLRSTLRSEANQSKLEIEKLKNEKDIEVSKVSAFEKELSEFKKIQEGSLEGKIDSSDKKKLVSQITESRQSIKMLKAEISSITSMKEMEIDSLRKEILKLGREKNDLEKDMIQHLGQLDEVKLQLNSTSGELNFLKNQLDSVEEEKILMEEDFQSKLDDQEEKMSHLEATVLKLRESNLNQHEAMMKRDKKKKKKKDKEKKKIKSPLSLMSSRKSNSAKLIDDDAAAKLLEQMMLNDVNEADADFIRRLNQDAQDMLHEESDFDSNLDTENEYGVDTDNDTVSEDGYRHYSKNMVVYDKILPNSSHDAYDSDIPLSTDESDNEYSLPMRHGRNLLGDRTSEEDDDSMYGSLHMQPMNLHSI